MNFQKDIMKKNDFSKLIWERIEQKTMDASNSGHSSLYFSFIERAKVVGGWLVRSEIISKESNRDINNSGTGNGAGGGITFVPDAKHDWKF